MAAAVPETFFALANLFPEALLLVTVDGSLLAANQAARLALPLESPSPDPQRLTDWVTESPEKLLKFLHLCARNRSMVPGVFTLRQRAGSPETCFYVEGAVFKPRSDDTAPILLLRWRPRQQVARKFIELNEQVERLSREMFLREKVAEERAHLYQAEQQTRQAVEKVARRIASLQDITAALSEALTPTQVARVIIERSLPVLGAAGGVVTRLNETQTELEILHFEGYSSHLMAQWGQHFPVSIPSPLTRAAQSGQAFFTGSLTKLAEDYPGLEQRRVSENQAWAALPLSLEGCPIGAIGLSFAEPQTFSDEERGFMLTLARQCALALERARLYEVEQQARLEAEANQQRLALLAEMRERNRLAQELHDTVAQALGYLNLKLAMTLTLLDNNRTEAVQAGLQELKQVVTETYTDVREEIFYLRARVLSDLSFMELLERYVDKYRRFYNLDIQLVHEIDPALFEFPPEATSQLVRTIQEALINIRKHAQVNMAVIRLGQEDGHIRIVIEDQGQGFDPAKIKEKSSSFGLHIMRERVESVGGSLEINTTPGQGTRIILRYS